MTRRWRIGVGAGLLAVGAAMLAACSGSGTASVDGIHTSGFSALAVQTSSGPAWCRSLGANLAMRELTSALQARVEGTDDVGARSVLADAVSALRKAAGDAGSDGTVLERAASAVGVLAQADTPSPHQVNRASQALTAAGAAIQSMCGFRVAAPTSSTTTSAPAASAAGSS